MNDLAPDITRQRLLIEGFYAIEVDEQAIASYFQQVAAALSLRAYGEPTIFSPSGLGKGDNQGYDAFIPLIDSGISLYVWSAKNSYQSSSTRASPSTPTWRSRQQKSISRYVRQRRCRSSCAKQPMWCPTQNRRRQTSDWARMQIWNRKT